MLITLLKSLEAIKGFFMAFKSYGEIIKGRNDQLAQICRTYLMAAPNEQTLRFLWTFCQALFQGKYVGYLVELGKAKDRSKVRLGIDQATIEDNEAAQLEEQQNSEAAIMEGVIDNATRI